MRRYDDDQVCLNLTLVNLRHIHLLVNEMSTLFVVLISFRCATFIVSNTTMTDCNVIKV